MPYSSIDKVPEKLRNINDVSLTLSQINQLAKIADSIGGSKGWAIAVSNFKRTHKIENKKWVKKREEEIAEKSVISVSKEKDIYEIVAISTAAIPDLEDETFSTEAIDYDIEQAKQTGIYPEFRLFHKKYLGVGSVIKMLRVGIFAVDIGYSYDDPFSKSVCENILKNNDGKWRVSRGFYLLFVAGKCPNCNSYLGVGLKHIRYGFKCPVCEKVYPTYRGMLKETKFLKTQTFDVTITDRPCVPYTSVALLNDENNNKEFIPMTKEELKEKLLSAGLDESVIEAKLSGIDEAELKEMKDLPDAEVLKEFEEDTAVEDTDKGNDLFLDEDSIDAIAEKVAEKVAEKLKTIEVSVKGLPENLEMSVNDIEEIKELASVIKELQAQVKEVGKKVEHIMQLDEKRFEAESKEAPRNAKVRILRGKVAKEGSVEKEEQLQNAFVSADGSMIVDANGKTYESLSDFVLATGD